MKLVCLHGHSLSETLCSTKPLKELSSTQRADNLCSSGWVKDDWPRISWLCLFENVPPSSLYKRKSQSKINHFLACRRGWVFRQHSGRGFQIICLELIARYRAKKYNALLPKTWGKKILFSYLRDSVLRIAFLPKLRAVKQPQGSRERQPQPGTVTWAHQHHLN